MIHFGYPYSPEMNPIEMLFGAWKKKAEAIPFSVHLGST